MNRVNGRKTIQYAEELEQEKEVMSDVVHSLVVGGFVVLCFSFFSMFDSSSRSFGA